MGKGCKMGALRRRQCAHSLSRSYSHDLRRERSLCDSWLQPADQARGVNPLAKDGRLTW